MRFVKTLAVLRVNNPYRQPLCVLVRMHRGDFVIMFHILFNNFAQEQNVSAAPDVACTHTCRFESIRLRR